MSLLTGKTALIFGLANNRSIAWGITKAFHEHGAKIGLSYAGEVLERRVKPLAAEIGATFVEPCDVTKDEEIAAITEKAKAEFGTIDILVHAIAYAGRDELSRPYVETSRPGFMTAMEIQTRLFCR